MQTFKDLGLSEDILKSLGEIGFVSPTEIQSRSIPTLLENKPDFIGLASTGTGKTAAFGLPLLHFLDTSVNKVFALILAPTRELAQQIAKELETFGKYKKGLSIQVVYGGTPITTQIRDIKRNTPHILVATPGRLQDLIDRKAIKLDQIEFLVLDEADEMLNMGFQEDIDKILISTPDEKVIWLFSATMPPEIRRIVGTYMEKPFEVKVHSDSKTNENIDHKYIYVNRSDKEAALKRVLDYLTDFYGVVFCKTKMDTQELAEYLEHEGYRAEPLHGDMSQSQRDAVMAKFRNKTTSILVATDVAARGIDVDSLTHVVHYSLPENPEYYTHRSGRTARAGKKGTSLAIVTQQDIGRIRFFEKSIGVDIKHIKVPLQSQMYVKKLEKWTEKVLHTDTIELTDDLKEKAIETFESLTKNELIEKILALEFNKLYKKVEKDDLNVNFSNERRDNRYGDRDGGRRDYGRDGGRDGGRREYGRDGGRDGGRDSGRESSRDRGGDGPRRSGPANPHMDTFFINIGKIDNVHPGILIDILAGHSGLNKKQIGNIDIQKRHCLVEIDKKFSKKMDEGKILKYRGRKITIKKEGFSTND
ncbi:MAG TPA: DEAD/DEAH box helicase [Saprospiraceae bacterium]|nr:DEAD/DEAH box helicase [Saprospiraceae bacterium]